MTATVGFGLRDKIDPMREMTDEEYIHLLKKMAMDVDTANFYEIIGGKLYWIAFGEVKGQKHEFDHTPFPLSAYISCWKDGMDVSTMDAAILSDCILPENSQVNLTHFSQVKLTHPQGYNGLPFGRRPGDDNNGRLGHHSKHEEEKSNQRNANDR